MLTTGKFGLGRAPTEEQAIQFTVPSGAIRLSIAKPERAAAPSPSGRFIHTRERVVRIEPPQNGELSRISLRSIRATPAGRPEHRLSVARSRIVRCTSTSSRPFLHYR
jgi:hypothetical protein